MGLINSRVGEITKNRYGTICKIIEYHNWENVIVEFQDNYHYHLHTTYQNFKNGELRNPYDPHICGCAYIGDGQYNIKDPTTNKNTIEYSRWSGIIHRCYDDKYNKAYNDCIVSDEWLCFQNFAKWFNDNYYSINDEKMFIDKDILVKKNKLYSKDTCMIVPETINLLFKNNKEQRGSYILGVSNSGGRIRATCSNEYGECTYLGLFETELDAFNAYKSFKENVIKIVADRYKPFIPTKLYNAMYNYEVSIDD